MMTQQRIPAKTLQVIAASSVSMSKNPFVCLGHPVCDEAVTFSDDLQLVQPNQFVHAFTVRFAIGKNITVSAELCDTLPSGFLCGQFARSGVHASAS